MNASQSRVKAAMLLSNNPALAPVTNQQQQQQPPPSQQAPPAKRKRNLPGTPDPNAEVIALSPRTLLATNRFVCEICGKGFQRDQNLQLHRRGHNLPWKLRQRTGKEPRKRVYVCPEKSCVHHNPSRALGDLTGIKKHFCRKHGEKKWKCDKCNKRYAVQSDWKAHSKTCGTREYRCDCGTLFSRRDSFITHRAFCDALTEETLRLNNQQSHQYLLAAASTPPVPSSTGHIATHVIAPPPQLPALPWQSFDNTSAQFHHQLGWLHGSKLSISKEVPSLFSSQQHANPVVPPADMSATALLQKAAQIGAVTSSVVGACFESSGASSHHHQQNASLGNVPFDDVLSAVRHAGLNQQDAVGREETRDFLGVGVLQQNLCSSSLPLHGWI